MKKRFMSLLLTAAMLISMAVVPAAAADSLTAGFGTPAATDGSTNIMPGTQFTVTVDVTANPGVAGIVMDVEYPHDILTLDQASNADAAGNKLYSNAFAAPIKDGLVRITLADGSNVTKTGTAATLTFTVDAAVTADSFTLELDLQDGNADNCTDEMGENVPASFTNCTVNITYPATATTGEPKQTSVTTAILNGSYTTIEGVTAEAAGIKWGTAEDALTNTADFGAEVTGNEGDTIYFQAYATVAGVDYVGKVEKIALEGPKASEIEITGEESITVTLEDSKTAYTAAVKDQFGADYAADVTWSMAEAYEGVTIENGVVTVTKAAQSGKATIKAVAGDASDTFEIAIDRPASEPAQVTISGASEITLPSLAEKTTASVYTATVIDQFGDEMPDAKVEWAVPMLDGVSIAEDGTLTIATEAGEVDFTVFAQAGDAERAELAVSVKKAASVATAISFAEDAATMTIPTDDNNKVDTFTAVVTDQYGAEMDAEVAYAFATADEFVSADKNTVTVKKGATAGTTYTLTATSGALTDTLTITVVDIEIVWDYTVATDAVYGDSWSDIVKLGKNGSASLEGETVKGKFEIVDAETVPGAGEQTFTVKFTSDDGVYVVTKTDVATIAKKVVKATWTGYKGLTYGDAVNINATSDIELTTSEVNSNAGTYTVTASIALASDAANYELDAETATLEYTIAKAKAAITVADQTIRASKTSEQLAAQIGTIQADGVNGEKIDGTLTVTDDISGKTPNAKAQKVNVSFAHENPNYETPVAGVVMVTFTEGDPQTITVADVTATYGDAAIANAATLDAGTGALSYASNDETVATVAADGTVTIVGAGSTTVTVTAAADGDWAETTTSYTVTVAPKAVTVSGITAADKVYDAKTDAVVDVTNAVVEGKVGEDDVTVASAKGAFADANVGEKSVAITDIVLTGAAVDNYVLSDAAVTATANITKADPAIEFEGLKQKPGNVEAVTAVVTPASEGVTVVVEYYIAPVEEVACDHVGDKLCTTDGSACQHTDCGCSYVAPADGYWTTDISLIQEKGEYPVRAYTEGDANLNAITVENAVTDTLVVKKSSGGGSSGGSTVTPPVVEEPEINFVDVEESDWFYDYVIEAVEKGLFAGTDDTHFSPDMKMNRAMMVTVMAALEFGAEGAPEGESDFTDLTADWYKNAVAWAADEKVTAGISDTEFGPDLALTREQVAVFLYAYAQLKGYDVSAGSINDIVSFNDIDDLSDWASTAMQWACAEGLLEGTPDGDLLPKAVATRAQVAVILVNFAKLING